MNLTAIIKMFLRDEYTFNCIRSLKTFYPDIKILVADDGYHSEEKDRKMTELGVDKYIKMPFNSGLTKGRNLLTKLVETDYVLIGDDDFTYTKDTDLEKMLKLTYVADLVGGVVRVGDSIRHYEGFINRSEDGKGLIYTALEQDNFSEYQGIKYKPCELTFNFFVAKTEIFNRVSWDENIRISYEHSDFFLTCKENGVKVVYTPDSIVNHRSEDIEISDEYKVFRDGRDAKDYFLSKRGFTYAVDMDRRKIMLGSNEILRI